MCLSFSILAKLLLQLWQELESGFSLSIKFKKSFTQIFVTAAVAII